MNQEKDHALAGAKLNQKVAGLSLACNIGLAALKVLVGVLSRSSALLADGMNSAGDCVSSVTMLIGGHVAGKPPDRDHPYGHGRAEYIFSAAMGVILLAVAWRTLTGAVEALRDPQPIDHLFWVLLTCGVTIATKLGLYIYSLRAGKKYRSPMIVAMGEDHRSDVFVTAGTALGVLGSLLGLTFLDGAVGILISGVIAFSAVRVLKESYGVLMGTAARASSPLVEEAIRIASGMDGVDHMDEVTASPVGTQFLVVIKFSVPGEMTVHRSHRIGKEIKEALMQDERVFDVIIHVNPMEEHVGPSKLPGGGEDAYG